MSIRKRDGGAGQQSQIVPLGFTFNEEAIHQYMDPALPDGVLVENTAVLCGLGFIKVSASDGTYRIVYPETEPT